jgi:outer membrane PBP1 activator LpoA protein
MAGGCVERQAVAPAAPITTVAESGVEDTTEALAARGAFDALAARYAAADLEDTESRLRGVLVQMDLGRWTEAQAIRASLPTHSQTTGRSQLVEVLALQQSGGDTAAYTLLDRMPVRGFDRYEQGLFLRSFGKAQVRRADPAALINLLNAEMYPLPANRRTELTHLIWTALQAQGADAGQARKDNPNLAGWLALHRVVAETAHQSDALQRALDAWRAEYAAHPAQQFLLDEILETMEHDAASAPTRIALILPESGPLVSFAQAVRHGFVSAHVAHGGTKIELRFLAGQGPEVTQAYQQAVKDGAQLVVGPLDKPGIEALATLSARPVPVLALNTLVASTAVKNGVPGLSQFGLLPEDEAVDLAERAWADGHRRVATLFANSELGSRGHAAFVKAWEALGGKVVVDTRYGNSADAYKAAIRRSFSLDLSERRVATLTRILNRPLVSETRARIDLDAIVLAADPVSARQIIPQFRYLDVTHLPIYATGQIYDGKRDPQADQDLEGVIFGARPWDLASKTNPQREVFDQYWRSADASARQLYAFGLDAYALAVELPRLTGDSAFIVEGATGRLSRTRDGRVHRRFLWSKFVGGVPEILAPAP